MAFALVPVNTEAETQWQTICRQHFEMHFLEWNLLYFDKKKHIPMDLICENSTLVLIMAWHRTGENALSDGLVKWRNHKSLSRYELKCCITICCSGYPTFVHLWCDIYCSKYSNIKATSVDLWAIVSKIRCCEPVCYNVVVKDVNVTVYIAALFSLCIISGCWQQGYCGTHCYGNDLYAWLIRLRAGYRPQSTPWMLLIHYITKICIQLSCF